MFRGGLKGGHSETPNSEIELCIESAERDALLTRQELHSAPDDESKQPSGGNLTPPSLFYAYLVVVGLPLVTFLASVLFLAQLQDDKVLSCIQDVAENALEYPRYVTRAPPKPGEGFHIWVVVGTVCSISSLFTLAVGGLMHLWHHPVERHPVSFLTIFHEFVRQQLSSSISAPKNFVKLTTSLSASGILLVTSISFGYWSGGANKPTFAVLLLASLTPLEIASGQLTKAVTKYLPISQKHSKQGTIQSFFALALVGTAVVAVTNVSGPLIWALINGQGISSLSNIAVKVEVECGMEGITGQAYELLLDGVIRSGPSSKGDETARTPFGEGRTPAVLRLAGDAYYVNAVDTVADEQAIPQWTVYSDEFWSLFHGGVSPNLLSFKATFRFRRKDVLAHIHVPQAPDIALAFPYAIGGAWQNADVSLTSVHSNLRVLCPQIVNGTREYSSRTFPTNLSGLRKLDVSIAMISKYCPSERTMYR